MTGEQKKTAHCIPFRKRHSGKAKTLGIEPVSMVARGRANQKGQMTRRGKGTFQGDENVFILVAVVVT